MPSGMVYLHAVMLLYHAGREINEDNIKNILQAAGINDYEEAYIKAIVNAVSKVNISEVIEQAKQAPVVATVPTTAPATPAEAEKKEEEKKEEKKKEKEKKKEEEALAGLAALFG